MIIADIMTIDPITIDADTDVMIAAEIMETHQMHHLPVVNSNRSLVGLVSDRDIRNVLGAPMIRNWKKSAPKTSVPVRTIMTTAPIAIEAHESIEKAANRMLEHHIGCLPVIRGENVIGIVTRTDFMRALIQLVS